MTGSVARLVYNYGTPTEREFPLLSPTATIGREAINEIVFDDPEISRRHVRVTQLAGRFIVEDLGSTNGTFLNGRRISTPVPLANGDVIDLGGSIRVTYLGPPGAAEATVVEPSMDQLGAPSTVAKPTPTEAMPGAVPTAPEYSPPQAPPQISTARAPSPAPIMASPPATEEAGGAREWSRYLIGCGCLLILAIVACIVTLVLLDYLAPDTLYCGPLQPIFDGLGFNPSCP